MVAIPLWGVRTPSEPGFSTAHPRSLPLRRDQQRHGYGLVDTPAGIASGLRCRNGHTNKSGVGKWRQSQRAVAEEEICPARDRRSCLAIAALAAIACSTVIHRAILGCLLACGLVSRKRHRANQRRENRKENFGVLFHTRFNLPPHLKLRARKDRLSQTAARDKSQSVASQLPRVIRYN